MMLLVVEIMANYTIVIVVILLVLNVMDLSILPSQQQTAMKQNVIMMEVITHLKKIQEYVSTKKIKLIGMKI